MKFLGSCVAILALGFVLTSCENEYSAFEEAKAANTAAAYADFLAQYPEGVNVAAAKERLDNLEWEATQAEGTAEAYEEYLRSHPEGIHKTEAELEAPKLAWQVADYEGTAEALDKFLGKYGSSAYVKKAKERRDILELMPKHLEVGAVKVEEQEGGQVLISAETRNIGEVAIVECNMRLLWGDENHKVVKAKDWLLVVPEQEGVQAPKELTTPIKPGDTRMLEFPFRKDKIEGWAGDAEHVKLHVLTIVTAEG